MSKFKWDWESVQAEARKYTTVIGFKAGSRGAYDWAERNNMVKEATAFMHEIVDPVELLRRIKQELDTSARHKLMAMDLQNRDRLPQPEYDAEAISEGTHLDFDMQMYDQTAEERSDRALDHVEALQKHGTPEQIHEAWVMYLEYQSLSTGVKTGIAEIVMQGEEQGGSL
jgi:hypothetical protein